MSTPSIEQCITAALNSIDADKLLIEQTYEYKSIFVNLVLPDTTNPRFFPAIMMSDFHASQMLERKITKRQLINIYNAKNKVIVGKGCIINCFKRGTNDWKKVNISIESIMELAANLAVSEIIQVPTIFPLKNGDFQILTGHRRFFAFIFANGIDSATHFKVYDKCPLLPKTKQFQENASRENLPQYGKLQAFEDALLEIEALNHSRKIVGEKALTIKETASILGVSMGAFDNYNVLTRYPAVVELYSNSCSIAFIQMKKQVLRIESKYKREFDKTLLNSTDKSIINDRIAQYFSDESIKEAPKKQSNTYFQIKKIGSVNALKKLLTSNVTELESDICWEELNWDDHKQVKIYLSKVIDFLNDT